MSLYDCFVDPFVDFNTKINVNQNLPSVDSPLSFIDYRWCYLIKTGRAPLSDKALTIKEIKSPIFLCYAPLIGMTRDFAVVHGYVSKRYYKGDVCFNTLLDTCKVLAYIEATGCENTDTLYDDAINAFSSVESFLDLDSNVPGIVACNRISELATPESNRSLPYYIPFNKQAVYGDESYYILFRYDLFWEVGFKVHDWGVYISDEEEDNYIVDKNGTRWNSDNIPGDICIFCSEEISDQCLISDHGVTHLECFYKYVEM